MMRGNGRGRTASLAVAAVLAVMMLPAAPHAQKARARELGLPIGGTPGPLDAITDVAGVEVGHTTLISGSGRLVVGQGPGPHRRHRRASRAARPIADPVFAAWFTLNGNGEMTGTTWVQESGLLEGPGRDHQHPQRRRRPRRDHPVGSRPKNALQPWWLPVVAETYDGTLNDVSGFHVKTGARARRAGQREGRAAAGRRRRRRHRHGLPRLQGRHRHRLAQAAGGAGRLHGWRAGAVQLRRAPRPADCRRAGRRGDPRPHRVHRQRRPAARRAPRGRAATPGRTSADDEREQGSIIVVVATDAPLLPHQLKRVATRVSLGIGRQGGFGGNSSGDIFIAFSTANPARLARRCAGEGREDASERSHHAALPGDGAGHRSGHHQRAARRRNDDRRRRRARLTRCRSIGCWRRCGSTDD